MTTPGRYRSLLLLIPLVLLALSACDRQVGGQSTPTAQALVPITPPPSSRVLSASSRCPDKPPEYGVRSEGKGLDRFLVPPGATRVRLCRYYALAGRRD